MTEGVPEEVQRMDTDGGALGPRRPAVVVNVGGVLIGGGHPVVVQSMTNTDTADIEATVLQVTQLAEAGSELVRLTVNTPAAARAVPMISERLRTAGVTVPLIGDFHFNGHILLPGNSTGSIPETWVVGRGTRISLASSNVRPNTISQSASA